MGKSITALSLSRRERQIMDAIYRLGTPTVIEIRNEIQDPPSGNALRTLLSILEQKGHIRHMEDGPRYVYEPVIPRNEMAVTSLQNVLRTFFEGSLESAVSTLLDQEETHLTEEQLDRILKMIERAKGEGR
jgi:predicted transcriptional regulator